MFKNYFSIEAFATPHNGGGGGKKGSGNKSSSGNKGSKGATKPVVNVTGNGMAGNKSYGGTTLVGNR